MDSLLVDNSERTTRSSRYCGNLYETVIMMTFLRTTEKSSVLLPWSPSTWLHVSAHSHHHPLLLGVVGVLSLLHVTHVSQTQTITTVSWQPGTAKHTIRFCPRLRLISVQFTIDFDHKLVPLAVHDHTLSSRVQFTYPYLPGSDSHKPHCCAEAGSAAKI
jgi:hypothetical protein